MMQESEFVMHMPPPMHRAAMVGQYVHDSERILPPVSIENAPRREEFIV